MDGEERGDGRDAEGRGEGGVERVLRLIAEKGGEGEWVGTMGFSQGTRVVGGLLADQQRRREMGLPRAEGEIEFRFGVLCMGASAPMVSDVMNGKLSFLSECILELWLIRWWDSVIFGKSDQYSDVASSWYEGY